MKEEMAMVMVRDGWSCEKDLKLVEREFQRRGEDLRKERSENLSLEMRVVRERPRCNFYQCVRC